MQSHRLTLLFASVPVLGLVLFSEVAQGGTPYAISATNVTMPASGLGSTQYTVIGIPMTGTLAVNCQYAGTDTNLKIPTCEYGPVHSPAPVTAGQTVTGAISFYPYGSAIPVDLHRKRRGPLGGLVLVGALFLGLRRLRTAQGWFAGVALAASAFIGLAGITACAGGSPNAMTPGTYQYTIAASNESGGPTPLGQGTTTIISVTVP